MPQRLRKRSRAVSSPVELDSETLIAEARARTGLRELGDGSFREPLERLLDSMEREGQLHEIGRATQRERVVGLLVNRLRVEDAYARNPEIEQEVIREPLFIVGLARTGTTLLHRTLAADPRWLSLLWWESRHPAPLERKPGEPDPRIRAAEEEVRLITEAAPELVAAHPLDAHAPDEEIMLLEHSFFSTNSEAYVDVPSFSRWLDAQDQTPGYLYLLRLLRLVQWQKRARGEPGTRWVLKSPHHLGFMDLLFAVFPDAQIVQTHRDPVETIPSFASLVHTIRTTGSDAVDAHAVGAQWCDRMRRGLEACMDHRQACSVPERFFDVSYERLAENPMREIAALYEFAGLVLTDAAAARMREWAVENARDRRPLHRYTLEQFGFSEAGLARDFARYRTLHLGAAG
jgi:hypothetical protein